jgi:dethiobiotin synthetase
MAQQAFFITGTDTGVGKTWASVALMQYFKNNGKSVIGMKPVASGCEFLNGTLVNSDALLLQANASEKLPYELVNPYAFEIPVSPHIAGKDNPADLVKIAETYKALENRADVLIVEGAGGWFSPLNDVQKNSDLAMLLGIPVIMVVGIRLGCINHALLTAQAMASSKVNVSGWIANCLSSSDDFNQEIIETLKKQLYLPLLGIFPYLPSPDFDRLATALSFDLECY